MCCRTACTEVVLDTFKKYKRIVVNIDHQG
jgi:diphthamide synthase subunit DPH2